MPIPRVNSELATHHYQTLKLREFRDWLKMHLPFEKRGIHVDYYKRDVSQLFQVLFLRQKIYYHRPQ